MPHLKPLADNSGLPSIYTYRPEIYMPWSAMSEALMNGPFVLTRGTRKLILFYGAGVAGTRGGR